MTEIMNIPTSNFCTWPLILEKLAFSDYIGNNPAKEGLFRAGSMDNEME